jgi:hypothetical protein
MKMTVSNRNKALQGVQQREVTEIETKTPPMAIRASTGYKTGWNCPASLPMVLRAAAILD